MSTVAFLGPRGTFSEEAALRFDPDLKRVLCASIEEVFETVSTGSANWGIVPVENSLEGSVSSTLEMLLSTDIMVCREIVLDINHNLLTLPGTKLKEIKEIVSHPHALAQCRDFINSLIGVKTRNFPSTAEAAREIREKNLKNSAAIAPKIAAELYGLNLFKDGVQDRKHNQTRFFVISLKCPQEEGIKKTSIVMGLKDRPGALYTVLGHFAQYGINLTKIESRPSRKGLGDYIFYIDFLGDKDNKTVQRTLDKIRDHSIFFKILGSYII